MRVRIGLIDSIFRNYYIPPIIFGALVSPSCFFGTNLNASVFFLVVKYNDDGSESRVCIDGKQRLTSIYRYVDVHTKRGGSWLFWKT